MAYRDLIKDAMGGTLQIIRDMEIDGKLRRIASSALARDPQGKVVKKGLVTIVPEGISCGTAVCYIDNTAILNDVKKVTSYTYDKWYNLDSITIPAKQKARAFTAKRTITPVLFTRDDGTKLITLREDMNELGGRVAAPKFVRTYRDLDKRIIRREVLNEAGEVEATKFTHSLSGHSTVIEPGELTGQRTLNSLGMITGVVTPDSGMTGYVYDEKGRLVEKQIFGLKTDLGYRSVKYRYDPYNRLFQVDYPDIEGEKGIDVQYTYYGVTEAEQAQKRGAVQKIEVGTLAEGAGRFELIDKQYEVTYDYGDLWVEETKMVEGRSYTTKRTYDEQGRIVSVNYPDGEAVNYTYNAAGMLEKIAGRQTYLRDLSYNERGQRVSQTYGNGVTTSYTYAPVDGRLNTMKVTNPAGETMLDFTYDFDEAGNLMNLFEEGNSTDMSYLAESAQAYSYTKAGSIKSASGVSGNDAYSQSFVFDGAQRIISKTSDQFTWDFDYTAGCGGTSPYKENHAVQCVRKMQDSYTVSETGFTYDRFGYLTGKEVQEPASEGSNDFQPVAKTAYQYDGGGRLTKISQFQADENHAFPDTAKQFEVIFAYDHIGQRVTKETEHYVGKGVAYKKSVYISGLYDETTWAKEGCGAGTCQKAKHISDGQYIIASIMKDGATGESTGVQFLSASNLGSTVLVTDGDGEDIQRYRYKPFGETWTQWQSEKDKTNPATRLFTNQEFDSETGLYYYNARYYDPELSTFISHDPAKSGLNHFAYGNNNPLKYTDPTGKDPVTITIVAILSSVGASLLGGFLTVGATNPSNMAIGGVPDAGMPGADGSAGHSGTNPAGNRSASQSGGGSGNNQQGSAAPPAQAGTSTGTTKTESSGPASGSGYGSGRNTSGSSSTNKINISADTDGTKPNEQSKVVGKPYSSPRAAADAIINYINPRSIFIGQEFCGWILSDPLDNFWVTMPLEGSLAGCDPGFMPMPPNTVGYYHTHGSYDAGYRNNEFSDADFDFSIYNFFIDISLGTPDGDFYYIYINRRD